MESMSATNESIAHRIGLSYSGVSRIRSGVRIPLVDTQLAIEKAFNWPIEEQARAIADGKYADEFNRRIAADANAAQV